MGHQPLEACLLFDRY
uniref:Uncharacterized protein n=1 Tax=Rhizophora mucronata TaxID=61149 RepID=A0A2P2PQ72_RHIMU